MSFAKQNATVSVNSFHHLLFLLYGTQLENALPIFVWVGIFLPLGPLVVGASVASRIFKTFFVLRFVFVFQDGGKKLDVFPLFVTTVFLQILHITVVCSASDFL